VLYLDNGKVFVTESLVIAGARLGFFVTHSNPGDPASRGKKERFYRTVRDQFLDLFLAKFQKTTKQKLSKEKPTLNQLNEEFSKWLYDINIVSTVRLENLRMIDS
jgi:putative transposase